MDYMTERCADCGYNFAFGRVHLCRGVLPTVNPVPRVATPASVRGGGTYKYRDPDKRRVQVREAVARYRAKRKP